MRKSTPKKLAYMVEYRQKNLERIQRKNREYYWAHREQMLAYGKAYRKRISDNMTEKELEERREYNRVMSKIYREQKREKLLLQSS